MQYRFTLEDISNHYYLLCGTMDKSPLYSFTAVDTALKCLSTKDRKDQILQYNVDKNLQIGRCRFTGSVPKTTTDYEQLIAELLSSSLFLGLIGAEGNSLSAAQSNIHQLKLTVTSMAFFDKLNDSDVLGSNGIIKGCFDETFEGITVGDKLREMLLNEYSEQADLFNGEEKSELIFHLFKTLAVGGALCQPDGQIDRYLDLTKDLYKELVTLYRDSKTDNVQFSGRAYKINSTEGLELFPKNPNSSLNSLVVVVDPLKKTVTYIKNDFKSFW